MSYNHSEPVHYTFYPCSPTKPNESDHFDLPIPRFLETDAVQASITQHGMRQEEGKVKLNKPDILERDKIITRTPDQNTTMGEPAVIAVRNFHDKYGHLFTEQFKAWMKVGFEARVVSQVTSLKTRIERLQNEILKPQETDTPEIIKIKQDEIKKSRQEIGKIVEESRFRFEWLHGESYRHTPMQDEPQRQENLGAAMAWLNTKMMIFEGVAKWFELNVPDIDVRTYRKWHKIFDSHVLNYIHFSVVICYHNITIKLTQEIDTYLENPEYVKASDLAGLVGILCMMIQNVTPLSVQPISIVAKPAPIEPVLARTKPGYTLFRNPVQVAQEDVQDAQNESHLEDMECKKLRIER